MLDDLKEIDELKESVTEEENETTMDFGQEVSETDIAAEYVAEGFGYEHGTTGEKNWKKAFACYEKAAELGNAEGIANMAYMYAFGKGIEKDTQKACELLQKAIELGSVDAKRKLEIVEKVLVNEERDKAYNPYFAGILLLEEGKRDEAVAVFRELAGKGSQLAKQRLVSMGEVAVGGEYVETAKKTFRKILSKGQSQKLKDLEEGIQIKAVENRPVVYVTAEVFTEKRELYTERVPSECRSSTCDCKKYTSDYELWNIKESKKAKNPFEDWETHTMLSDSLFVENCDICGCTGSVDCTHCNNGREICPRCNGNRSLTCGSCGGRGEVECSQCYGRGYCITSGLKGYDEENRPVYGDIKQTCSGCAGSGRRRCGNCGGGGSVTCGTCQGWGDITCRTCGGTMKVTCNSCSGMGYFLNSVNLKQDFSTDRFYDILDDYYVDKEVYGEKAFTEFEPNKSDIVLTSETSTEQINSTGELSELDGVSYDISGLMEFINEKHMSVVENIKNYRMKVWKRDVLDVAYIFNKHEYNMILDTTTEQVILDANPYEQIADTMLEEMQTYVNDKRYKSFMDAYAEFEAITGSEDVKHDVTELAEMKKALGKTLMKPAAIWAWIGHYVTYFFGSVGKVYSHFGLSGWITLAIAVGLSVLLAYKYWQYIAKDEPKKTQRMVKMLAACIGAVLAILKCIFL